MVTISKFASAVPFHPLFFSLNPSFLQLILIRSMVESCQSNNQVILFGSSYSYHLYFQNSSVSKVSKREGVDLLQEVIAKNLPLSVRQTKNLARFQPAEFKVEATRDFILPEGCNFDFHIVFKPLPRSDQKIYFRNYYNSPVLGESFSLGCHLYLKGNQL